MAGIRRHLVPRVADPAAWASDVAPTCSRVRDLVGVAAHRRSAGDVVSLWRAASQPARWLLIGIAAMLTLHGAGWVAAAIILWQNATFHIPRMPSPIAIGLALVVLRAASAPRHSRRLVVVCALAVAAVAFVAVPLPQQFEGNDLAVDTASTRHKFEIRFRVGHGLVNFHSHLADVLMVTLDQAFGRSDASPSRAYDALSRLAGLLFLIELGAAAAWHKWSRQSCRYVGLAMATPLCLLYFGYWALGYLSMAAGVVPLLALARRRSTVQADASTLAAGFLQGLHTALHGFGMLGVAGGALAALSGRGDSLCRLLRTTTFASSAVAMYVGWIFLYVAVASLSIVSSRELGYRPIFETAVFEHRIANPLLSEAGLGEFGLFSALSGVPILALALLLPRRTALVPAILYALPGLVFLVRWWPVSAPYNLDLLLSVFPGVFAACWVVASSQWKSMSALVVFVCLHVLLWTTLGSDVIPRVWVAEAP